MFFIYRETVCIEIVAVQVCCPLFCISRAIVLPTPGICSNSCKLDDSIERCLKCYSLITKLSAAPVAAPPLLVCNYTLLVENCKICLETSFAAKSTDLAADFPDEARNRKFLTVQGTFVRLLVSYREIMFFKRVNVKCQIKIERCKDG